MSNNKSILHDLLAEANLLKHSNECDYHDILNHFRLLATSRFKWVNLPADMDSDIIEGFLYEYGQVGFYDDPTLGFICVPCTSGSNLNIYGQPESFTLKGITTYNKTVNSSDFVRIKANDLAYPLVQMARKYALRVFEIESIWLQNLRQQRFPYIIGCNKSTELTLKKIFEKLYSGEEAIFTDEKLNMSKDPAVTVLQTQAPFLIDKLHDARDREICGYLSRIGINNFISDKKERLLVSEVNVNNGQILMNLEVEYKNRKKACEQINNKYGLNMNIEKVINDLSVDFIGGVTNGALHSGATKDIK